MGRIKRLPQSTKSKTSEKFSIPKEALYFFSLRTPYIWTTSLVTLLLFLLYLFLDLFLKSPNWVPLIPALFLYFYVLVIWVLFFIRLFGGGKQTRVDEVILLVDLFLLYLFTLMQYTGIHATIARLDKKAFVGIPGDASPIVRIGLSLFLAMETISALGTGAIFANNESPWGYISIGAQSIQSLLFLGLIIAKVIALIQTTVVTAIKTIVNAVIQAKIQELVDAKIIIPNKNDI